MIPSSAPTVAALAALARPELPSGAPESALLLDGARGLAIDLVAAVVLVLAALVVVAIVRRARPDRGLAVLAGRGYSAWSRAGGPAGEGVFWGRLEVRDGGLELAFDRTYSTGGEPRRSALLLDADRADELVAIVREHAHDDLSATLVRDEVERAAERARTSWWRGARAFALGAIESVDAFLPDTLAPGASSTDAPARTRPVQDARFLEGRRGERVVVELASGARLGGRLVAVGRRWLALVADADGNDRSYQLTTTTADAPVHLERDGRGVEFSRAERPFVLDELRDDERRWKLGVVMVPGAPLYLPWDGDLASNVRARVRCANGYDLLVPRSSARVVFRGEVVSDAVDGETVSADTVNGAGSTTP